jgi:Leucine-rich repeat (LRR) protein
LKELHFYQNNLSQFPLALSKIPNLWQLHINFNALSAIPEEIGQMKNLKDLAINYNAEIKDLPKVFWTGLKSLK